MAVARKHKRRIVVDGAVYYWFVREEDEHTGVGSTTALTIVSDDKEFMVVYPIDQNCPHNFIVVVGKRFAGPGMYGSQWRRVACTKWDEHGAITPGVVQEIIVWSLADKDCAFVNYLGEMTQEHV